MIDIEVFPYGLGGDTPLLTENQSDAALFFLCLSLTALDLGGTI